MADAERTQISVRSHYVNELTRPPDRSWPTQKRPHAAHGQRCWLLPALLAAASWQQPWLIALFTSDPDKQPPDAIQSPPVLLH